MPSYYSDWEQSIHECRSCSWSGRGSDLKMGEVFRDLYEVDCPECDHVVTLIVFSTVEEARRNWDKLSNEAKRGVRKAEALHREFTKRKLRDPAQLPDLQGDKLIIDWDIDYREGGDTLLRYQGDAIWREPSWYEGSKRFVEVGEILIAK